MPKKPTYRRRPAYRPPVRTPEQRAEWAALSHAVAEKAEQARKPR